MVLKPAVFLDRDGVLNRPIIRNGRPFPPANPQDIEVLPGVTAALSALRAAGFLLIMVTNQPDVARGTTTKALVEEINAALKDQLSLDVVLACMHDDPDMCSCRKPKPGLLLAGAKEFGVDLSSSFMVGDRWRDIEAGNNAGCTTLFIEYGYDEKHPEMPDYRVTSLLEAAKIILKGNES